MKLSIGTFWCPERLGNGGSSSLRVACIVDYGKYNIVYVAKFVLQKRKKLDTMYSM